jgi:type III secretion system YscD/HrpQ family protein
MAAKLVAEEGILKELVLSLEEGDHWVIGRDPDACQLLIEDPSASRKHALCQKTTEGILLENLSSTNPVQVNDEEVSQPRLLRNGDAVRIGGNLFRFYETTSAEVFDEEPTKNGLEEPIAEKSPSASAGPLPEQKKVEEEHEDTIFGEDEDGGDIAKIHFDLMEVGRWLLKVVGGPNSGAEFSMQAGNTYVLGTDPNTCDIVFHDNSVSRQHVRITVSPEDVLTLQDLKSRNGTRIEGELIEGQRPLPLQTLVVMGTTSFVVYDREGEMQTIISPLLPSIVKTLQHEEKKDEKAEAEKISNAISAMPLLAPEPPPVAKPKSHALGTFVVIAMLMGLFVIVGLGVSTLFKHEEVALTKPVDADKLLNDALTSFPSIKYSFNKTTGHLLLIGHLLTSSDKNELMYNLQGINAIKDIDDSGVIIDEYVWSEADMLLARNPLWKGISIHATAPGRFVLSGALQTRQQSEQLWDYVTRNFSYLDLLENRVVVEEDIVNAIRTALYERGLRAIKVEIVNGEIVVSGHVPVGKLPEVNTVVTKFKDVAGSRGIYSTVTEVAPQEAVVNISDRYTITGFSKTDSGNLAAIINGRILAQGDVLDGMKIIQITQSAVILEKDEVRYRINAVQ